jgi:hypothetical protein
MSHQTMWALSPPFSPLHLVAISWHKSWLNHTVPLAAVWSSFCLGLSDSGYHSCRSVQESTCCWLVPPSPSLCLAPSITELPSRGLCLFIAFSYLCFGPLRESNKSQPSPHCSLLSKDSRTWFWLPPAFFTLGWNTIECAKSRRASYWFFASQHEDCLLLFFDHSFPM